MKKFIAFEGLDGAGKSTLIQSLVEELKKQQKDFVLTREPGGTELAEKIRQLLLSTDVEKPSEKTELLLYEASRAQHVSQVIAPALEKGDWVICDRFTASTLAFQAGGRGLSESDIHWLIKLLIRILVLTPIYQVLLLLFGYIFFQYRFFYNFVKKFMSFLGCGFLFRN